MYIKVFSGHRKNPNSHAPHPSQCKYLVGNNWNCTAQICINKLSFLINDQPLCWKLPVTLCKANSCSCFPFTVQSLSPQYKLHSSETLMPEDPRTIMELPQAVIAKVEAAAADNQAEPRASPAPKQGHQELKENPASSSVGVNTLAYVLSIRLLAQFISAKHTPGLTAKNGPIVELLRIQIP